jgi:hypothetical protein
MKVEVNFLLLPTVSRPVCVGVRHPPIWCPWPDFITVRQLRACWCGAPSVTRGRVCNLQLLMVLASEVIRRSQSHGTHDDVRIILSQIRESPTWNVKSTYFFIPQENGRPVLPPGTGFPFHHLPLRGLGWRYSNRLHSGQVHRWKLALTF